VRVLYRPRPFAPERLAEDLRPDFDVALPEERAPAAFDEDLPDAFAEDFDEDPDFDGFGADSRELSGEDLAPEVLRGLFAGEPAEDLLEALPRVGAAFLAVRDAAFDAREASSVVRETAFDVRPATLRAARVVLRAASRASPESTAAEPTSLAASASVRATAEFSRAAVETAFSIAVFALEGPSVAGPGRSMSPAAGLTVPTASAAVSSAAFASPAACSPACPTSFEAVSTAPPRTPRAASRTPPPLFFVAIFASFGEFLAVGCWLLAVSG
jgi:hypothetical protein